MDPTKPPGIKLVSLFLKEANFRHRTDPIDGAVPAFPETGSADLEISFFSGPGEAMAVSLRVSNDADQPDPRYDYSVEVVAMLDVDAAQANMPVNEYATRFCPALLYPFAREAVANLTSRGRFGPIWLNPFNIQNVVDLTQVDALRTTDEHPLAQEASSKELND